MRSLLFLSIFLLAGGCISAQEFNARFTVNASQVGTTVPRSTFTTLQSALNNFINNQKWTTDVFAPNERINCNFFLTLTQAEDQPNVYLGQLTVQAARPVFNSSYNSPIINFKDDNIAFKYVEYQQLEFNPNRVAGTDPQIANLTAIVAYYAYIILGMDYSSFSPRGGDAYFEKAQSIVTNAPDGRAISGWRNFDGLRNRYWLVTDVLNPRYALVSDVLYKYYREGMDKLYTSPEAGRNAILDALVLADQFSAENPNTMILQFFFQGKGNELVKVFADAPPQVKIRARDLLTRVDINNANLYTEGLK